MFHEPPKLQTQEHCRYRGAKPVNLPPVVLSDEAILKVIEDCQLSHGGRVRGVAVREELKRRFGVRAGTDRIYRLLHRHQVQAGQGDTQALKEQLQCLSVELEAARNAQREAEERERLAAYREEMHLARWAGELHALREKVARYETQGGVRTQAQLETERLRLLKEVARQRQVISALTALLERHGIQVPSDLSDFRQ